MPAGVSFSDIALGVDVVVFVDILLCSRLCCYSAIVFPSTEQQTHQSVIVIDLDLCCLHTVFDIVSAITSLASATPYQQ